MPDSRPVRRRSVLAAGLAAGGAALLAADPAVAQQPTAAAPRKVPVATGYGGAVSTVDADATRIGLDVLRRGGNAVDAAVAAAAALGVAEPYSCGIGGGGYFVYYSAKRRRVSTLDGRETAPAAITAKSFLDPATGKPYPFADAVTSGLGVGTLGTPATWARALDLWGSMSLRRLLGPAAELAEHGFTVDATFRLQTEQNAERFAKFPATAAIYLPGGRPPEVGSRLKNPDMAATYRELGRRGVGWLYDGRLGEEIVRTARRPPTADGVTVLPGLISTGDLDRYKVLNPAPSKVRHAGLDIYAMANSSSGGPTNALALNILERSRIGRMDEAAWLHHYLEATRLAYADRNRWMGDPAFVRVPMSGLLAKDYAAVRARAIDPDKAGTSPAAPGDPSGQGTGTRPPADGPEDPPDPLRDRRSTTHLVTADRWGNVVSYTFTIEQTGGSGITVPGRGFILNNELTDFNFAPLYEGVPDPNLPAAGKRPRSSISPTIALDRDGRPKLALGSPGGATIITTVLQTLVRRLDRDQSLPKALAATRISQRNSPTTQCEPAFDGTDAYRELKAMGHEFSSAAGEIGAETGLEFLTRTRIQAVAEPVRRGGGAAAVVDD